MRELRFFQTLLIFGALLGALSIYFSPTEETGSLIAEAGNTYMGPVGPVPGNPELVQIQILVKDDPNPSGVEVTRVQFNQRSIPLKTRDIYGNRGGASFQLPPGSYSLKWTVNRDKFAWPREIDHEEIVHVSPRDNWIQVEIVGNDVTIN